MKLRKTWFTILLFCLFAAIPSAFPPLERFRILDLHKLFTPFTAWRPGALSRVFLKPSLTPTAKPNPTPAAGAPLAASAPVNQPLPSSFLTGDYAGKNWPVREDVQEIVQEPPENVSIQDYGCGMDHFYAALARTEQKQPDAITRICHFGDSPISADLISGAARSLLQDKFGDAGHGWILIAKPWDFYYHEGVVMEGKGWKVNSPVLPGGVAGSYGLGGASFTAGSPSAFSRIHTTKKDAGSAVSRFDIFYRAQPRGGSFLAYVDREEARNFPTQADTKGSAMVSITVEDGRHLLKVTPKGDGPVTLYGVALERNTPGVVYDTLGMLGGTVRHLTLFHEDTWIQDLQNRKPDLVILNFGTNESNYGYLPYPEYIHNYSLVIQRIRRALPNVSILIMAPMDRGARDDEGDIVTIPSIPTIVAAQRRVAQKQGVAFYNTFSAMGGMATMARWYEDEPRLATGDFTHPTHLGAQQLGQMLVDALLKGYDEYKRNLGSKPCVPVSETGKPQ